MNTEAIELIKNGLFHGNMKQTFTLRIELQGL